MIIFMKILYIIGAIIALSAIVKLSLFGQDVRKFLRYIWGDNNDKYKIKEEEIKQMNELMNNEPIAVGLSIVGLTLFLMALFMLWYKT